MASERKSKPRALSVDELVEKGDPGAGMEILEEEMMKRIKALRKTSKKGCGELLENSDEFDRFMEDLAENNDEKAVLDDPYWLNLIGAYDGANRKPGSKRKPFAIMVIQRDLVKMMMFFKSFGDEMRRRKKGKRKKGR